MTWLNWSCVGAFSNFHEGNCEEGKSFEEDKEKKKKKGEIIRAERKFHENVERGKYFMNIIADNDDRTGKYWTGI